MYAVEQDCRFKHLPRVSDSFLVAAGIVFHEAKPSPVNGKFLYVVYALACLVYMKPKVKTIPRTLKRSQHTYSGAYIKENKDTKDKFTNHVTHRGL